MNDRFYIAPLREAFLRSGYDPQDIALFAGIMRRERGIEKPDVQTLKRKLGLIPKSGSPKYVTYITRDNAVRIIRAMNLDPVDFEL